MLKKKLKYFKIISFIIFVTLTLLIISGCGLSSDKENEWKLYELRVSDTLENENFSTDIANINGRVFWANIYQSPEYVGKLLVFNADSDVKLLCDDFSFRNGCRLYSNGDKVYYVESNNKICEYDIATGDSKILTECKIKNDSNTEDWIFLIGIDNDKIFYLTDMSGLYYYDLKTDESFIVDKDICLMSEPIYSFAKDKLVLGHYTGYTAIDTKTGEEIAKERKESDANFGATEIIEINKDCCYFAYDINGKTAYIYKATFETEKSELIDSFEVQNWTDTGNNGFTSANISNGKYYYLKGKKGNKPNSLNHATLYEYDYKKKEHRKIEKFEYLYNKILAPKGIVNRKGDFFYKIKGENEETQKIKVNENIKFDKWESAYKNFIFNREFLNTGKIYTSDDAYFKYYSNEENDRKPKYLKSYNVDFSDYVATLYDFESDGVPELMISNGFSHKTLSATNIYEFIDGKVKYKNMGPALMGAYCVPSKDYQGIFTYFPEYDRYWSYFNINKSEEVDELIYIQRDPDTGYERIEQVTDNDSLFDASQNKKIEISYNGPINNTTWDNIYSNYMEIEAAKKNS